MVKLYGPRLEAMSKQYAERGVAFLGINSNRQDRPRQNGAYARQYGVTFPILKDPDNSIADLFAANGLPSYSCSMRSASSVIEAGLMTSTA